VNPEKLPDDRSGMICAACHVRGQDLSGTYYFPVGYMPGEDLGRYYVPSKKQPEETNTQAILRLFESWKSQRAANEGFRCEVCLIPGKEQKQGNSCLNCHNFSDHSEHTHHAASVELSCSDCHVQKSKGIMEPQDLGVHSYGYFLVHADKCYDERIQLACSRCHEEKGSEWARVKIEGWRQPVALDH
jgi:hypothetical protein